MFESDRGQPAGVDEPPIAVQRKGGVGVVVHDDGDHLTDSDIRAAGQQRVEQAADMVAKLKAAGVPHRYVHFADRGHMGITDEVIKEARAFIAELEQKKP